MSTASGTILIIDDERNIRLTLRMVLEGEGYDVLEVGSAEDGLKLVPRERPDAVLLDVNLPGMDGLACLKALMEHDADLPVVMISGHASIQDAVEATRIGAQDFLEKPLSRERVLVTVANALRTGQKNTELRDLKVQVERPWAGGLVGSTPVMQKLRDRIAKVAPTRGRVLITGESGTGKELIARAVHEASDRAHKPFIKVNCAAIPATLIESELFGHEKGAFTHAVGRRRGQFEQADGGTLFLDEIGDMSLDAQAKVLRVLQTGELTRVGGEKVMQVDVRVIAATNKNLEEACQNGEFREDLYFRLNVVPLLSPPLRVRRADVPVLARHFLAQVCEENGFKPKTFSEEALQALQSYNYPGNVRELRNIVERMVILSGDVIGPEDVPDGVGGGGASTSGVRMIPQGTLREMRDAAERSFIESRLRENDWNISRTAESLGLERTNLHKKMKSLGIKRGN
ncbi:MAG: sigma-54-dependent transcriptional regulator [Bradymonadia bacterium]